MTTKKLGRVLSVAAVAFALAVLLAVSSFAAYSYNIDGTVGGLEDGVSYTIAKYDFYADAYGEYTPLTYDTQLAVGVYGIKTGEESDPEVFWAYGAAAGQVNFWNFDTNKISITQAKKDGFSKGVWTYSSDGAVSALGAGDYRTKDGTTTIYYNLEKARVLAPVTEEVEVQKTVTVEGTEYPVYLIGETEYYLNSESYYAVADNALFEGDATGATAVMETVTQQSATPWANAQGLTGEDNRLQETIIRYGLTDTQVVPAKYVNSFLAQRTPSVVTGGLKYNTGYGDADLKGTFTFVVKVPGVAEPEKYVVDINPTMKEYVAPEAMKASEGYLVGIEYAPYANVSDDMLIGNHADPTAPRCYGHIYFFPESTNGMTTENLPVWEAPAAVGGYGRIGVPDATLDYEVAPLLLNSKGTALEAGTWEAYDANKRDYVGLYAVREVNGDRASAYTVVYVYGADADRAALGALRAFNDSGSTHVDSKGWGNGKEPAFMTGLWTAEFANMHVAQGLWDVWNTGSNIKDTSYMTKFRNAKAALAELNAAETPDAGAIATQEANLLAAQTYLADAINNTPHRYGFAADEIIKTSELNSFKFTVKTRWHQVNMTHVTSKVVAFVADANGNITQYTHTFAPQAYNNNAKITNTIDFTSFLPAEGYVVGLEIWPYTNVAPTDIVDCASAGSFAILLNVDPAGYSIDATPALPVQGAAPSPIGYVGVIGGLENGEFDVAPVTINENGDGIKLGAWEVFDPDKEDYVGLYAVREAYVDHVSETTYVYVYGSQSGRQNLFQLDASTNRVAVNASHQKFVPGYWTSGKQNTIATHSTFGKWYLGTLGGHTNETQQKAVNTAYLALQELEAAETPDANAIAQAKATLLAAQTTIANAMNNVSYKYAFAPDEIIKTSEAKSITVWLNQNNAWSCIKYERMKFIAYVIDENGNLLEPVEYVATRDRVNADGKYGYGGTTNIVNLENLLPENGYLVAIEIFPSVDIKPEEVLAHSSVSATAYGNQRYNIMVDPATYVIDEFVLPVEGDAPTGITYDDGVVSGLEADKTYEYGIINVHGVENWTEISGATSFEYDLTGLLAVRYKGDNKTNSGSNNAIVYYPGSIDERSNIIHTTSKTAAAGANAGKAMDVIDVASSGGWGTHSYVAGKWTGMTLTNGLWNNYGYDPLILGTTDTPLGTKGNTAYNNGEITGVELVENYISKVYYAYEFLPEEIIKMEEFESFTFRPNTRQTGVTVTAGQMKTVFILWVVNDNGQLVARGVEKVNNMATWQGTTVTITLDDFTETDGYIVAIEILPFGACTDDIAFKTGTTNTDFCVYLGKDAYKASPKGLPVEAPNLTIENGVVTGFVAGTTYEVAPYFASGAGEWTTLEDGITEYALANVGLTAIRIKSEGIYEASTPKVFYKASKKADQAAIGTYQTATHDKKGEYTQACYDKTTAGFVVGKMTNGITGSTYRLTYVSDLDGIAPFPNSTMRFLDQTTGGLNSAGENGAALKLWFLTHTKEEAQALLDAEEANKNNTEKYKAPNYEDDGVSISSYNNNSYHPEILQTEINEFYAVTDRNVAEELAALKATLTNAYTTNTYLRYAYEANEILPVDELLTVKFGHRKRQGAINFQAKAKVVVYVADENGKITGYDWLSAPYMINEYNKEFTVDVQSIQGLPSEGWVVAVDFFPYGEIDNSTYTNTPTNIAYHNLGWSFDQNHSVMALIDTAYEVAIPSLPKPEITYADGVISGLDASKTYKYGRYTPTGLAADAAEVTGVETVNFTATTGVWGIIEVSTDTAEATDSAPAFLAFVESEDDALREGILHTKEATKADGTVINVPVVYSVGSYGANKLKPVVFTEGTWSGMSLNNALAINYGYNALVLGTTDCTVPDSYGQALNTTNEALLAAATEEAFDAMEKVYYSYQYTPDEVIPMEKFIAYSFKVARRQGSIGVAEGNLQTKFVFKVVTENGDIVDRVVYKDIDIDQHSTVAINIRDFAETDGYIVGMVIYPVGGHAEGTVLKCRDKASHDFNVYLQDTYTIVSSNPTEVETPVLSLKNLNAVITVDNYNPACEYAYSADGGETWTVFTGDNFKATKASTEYLVKSIENQFYPESETASIVSPAGVLVGTSLVLEDQIGIKVYIDVDMELVDNVQLYFSKYNTDFSEYSSETGTAGKGLYLTQAGITLTYGQSWADPITLDEDTGYYTTTIYVPAKDVDNIHFQSDLGIYLKSAPGTRIQVANPGFDVEKYIADAKKLADAGNEEFIAAMGVIESLEEYAAYADNYFNKGALGAYVSTASTDGITDATRTNAALEGIEFYGTSLILEDQVTIRHYFTVSDKAAFEAAGYTSDIAYGTKGAYIYYDIKDIPAQKLGDKYTLTINDAEGVAYEINYSVTNYIKSMMNDTDASLVSLVNAMYDYYLAAADYAN